ncbi:MAG: ribonuclease-3 [Lentimonas sp.]|jgi:ribonuclease-3
MHTDLQEFAHRLGHPFKEPQLLERALTHSSCDAATGNNQRLEFLGDAVLDLLIAEIIYLKFPDVDEGALDHLRASIVNGKSLAEKATRLELGAVLRVGESQRLHHPEPSYAMLEDALEAVLGAIYLDGGIESARDFVNLLFGQTIAEADTDTLNKNPKGQLQELSQLRHAGAIPQYTLLAAEGPDHNRQYIVAVEMNGETLAQGIGSSKKHAELAAAHAALKQLNA